MNKKKYRYKGKTKIFDGFSGPSADDLIVDPQYPVESSQWGRVVATIYNHLKYSLKTPYFVS